MRRKEVGSVYLNGTACMMTDCENVTDGECVLSLGMNVELRLGKDT